MPLPDGDVVILEEATPQSYPVDAPVFVQMAPRKPIDLKMTAGNSLTMKVTVKGSPYLVYTWRYKGWIIEGQSSDTYTIPSVQPVPAGQVGQAGQAGSYTVTITNSTSVAISSFVNLTVVPRVAPAPTGP